MKTIQGSVEGSHILLTGPVSGVVQLEDGRTVDVSPAFVELSDADDVEEVAHLIAMKHVEEGHPALVERDDDPDSDTHGEMVQRPFDYVPPKRFAHHMKGVKPHGVRRKGGEHAVHPDHKAGHVPESKKG